MIIIGLLFCFTNTSFAFETAQGSYVSQQDLIRLLRDIFFQDAEVSDFQLNTCVGYRDGFNDNDPLFQLGFPNLETGELMTLEPDSSYVLFIDSCVSEISKSLIQNYNQKLMEALLGIELLQEIESIRKIGLANPLSYTPSSGISSNDKTPFSVFQYFVPRVEYHFLPDPLKEKIIKQIFIRSFGSSNLIPKIYFEKTKKQILALPKTTTIETFLIFSFKKAIINDYLLLY